MTHICAGNLTIIGSDNGLSLLIGPLGTNFHEMLIEIHTFSFKKIPLKMSVKWWQCYLGLSELKIELRIIIPVMATQMACGIQQEED